MLFSITTGYCPVVATRPCIACLGKIYKYKCSCLQCNICSFFASISFLNLLMTLHYSIAFEFLCKLSKISKIVPRRAIWKATNCCLNLLQLWQSPNWNSPDEAAAAGYTIVYWRRCSLWSSCQKLTLSSNNICTYNLQVLYIIFKELLLLCFAGVLYFYLTNSLAAY